MSIIGFDGKRRCFGSTPPYTDYHDSEWGRPSHDDIYLFEMLILEGAQAGLNWETILKKRESYRAVFYNFDPIKVAEMTDADLDKQLLNPNIIRNRLKVYSTRKNARLFLKIVEEFGSFDTYLWRFVNNTPIVNRRQSLKDIPASTALSEKLSKDLKKRGLSFVGPTIIYAYMQAVGMVDDHIKDCWLV